MQKTFGPVVIQPEGKDEFVAKCLHQGYYCVFSIGGRCSHVRGREDNRINPDNTTPDWCEMKQSALDDARFMAMERGGM